MKPFLDGQRHYWDEVFAENPDMFGYGESYSARKAAELLRNEGCPGSPAGAQAAESSRPRILELGAGQGRDAFFFARKGFQVDVLDYSETGIETIRQKAGLLGLERSLILTRHDVREPLPFPDETFDACYSHMLFCMALTDGELITLAGEVRRVLKKDGLHLYTARHTGDPHYGQGIQRGEALYEMDGFIVHFFSREKVNTLSGGFDLIHLESFEEGNLPRRLFFIVMKRKD